MAKVLVVYCSMSGNTKATAEAVAAGAAEAGAPVEMLTEVFRRPGHDALPLHRGPERLVVALDAKLA